MVCSPTIEDPFKALRSTLHAEIVWSACDSTGPLQKDGESLLGEMSQGWANQDDLRVVQGFLGGLPGAREALGERLACVSAYIAKRNSKLGRPLDASALDDLSQDCHMAILLAVESYTGESPIAAWAQGFVRYAFLKYFRIKRGESSALLQLQKDFVEPETTGPDLRDHSTIVSVLDQLLEIERRTLSMRILEEMPFPDIAAVLGEPVTTTKSRFARLVVRLGPQLKTFWKSEYDEGNE
ncbi:MAG: RNA polymerase sigma factor [Planctomycetes bacterium]|nr:RNA polymerase sigma factor [Planctomycetota bacterium]